MEKTDAEWRQTLTPAQYAVLRGHGTEPPGSCALLAEKRAGTFSCAGLRAGRSSSPAASSRAAPGWPSFFEPLEGSIETTVDRSYGMTRTEVHCSRCGGHLGHVFPDRAAADRAERYCINGVVFEFEEKRDQAKG